MFTTTDDSRGIVIVIQSSRFHTGRNLRKVRTMIPDSFLDQLSGRINELLPEQLPQNIKNSLRAIIEASFSKLDLVTREEFDVQREVLLRTREKVDFLQKELAAIEENRSN